MTMTESVHGIPLEVLRAGKGRPMLLLQFLPEEFSVQDMQALHAAVLNSPDRHAFYRKARSLNLKDSPKIGRITIPTRRKP